MKNEKNMYSQLPPHKAPTFVWENVQEALDKEDRRKTLLVWIKYSSGIAAALAIIVTGNYFRLNPENQRENFHNTRSQTVLPKISDTPAQKKNNPAGTKYAFLDTGQINLDTSVPALYTLDFSQSRGFNGPVNTLPAGSRKVIRGGVWKDVSYFLENDVQDSENIGLAKNEVGFRNVESYVGRSEQSSAGKKNQSPVSSENVQFTNSTQSADGSVVYAWTFGDGSKQPKRLDEFEVYQVPNNTPVDQLGRTINSNIGEGVKLGTDYDTDAAFGFDNNDREDANGTFGLYGITTAISQNKSDPGAYQLPTHYYKSWDLALIDSSKIPGLLDSIFLDANRLKPKNLSDPLGTESYAPLIENNYLQASANPQSTFSIDVDNASYSNSRRMILGSALPPKDAVRIEEFVNYFHYDYPNPEKDRPFSISTESAVTPWNPNTRLLSIGLHGYEVPKEEMPMSNLVFLVDVSGSMMDENKLPLVKKSLEVLVNELGENDKISIVVYAGAAGLVLPPTHANNKTKIMEAIAKLESGGSTAGGAGIRLAYKTARENFVQNGNNRIILVTDGDFNVGESSDAAMQSLIEEERNNGIFLTACGFGMGNYQDSKLEIIADKGNGNYFYIDNLKEAQKVFKEGIAGTLLTIAKDVKIQVEFNSKYVKAYRLVGYENRKLQNRDFADDTKDAGELGAGHTVTAFYEIVPAGSNYEIPEFTLVDSIAPSQFTSESKEMVMVRLRYKKPTADKSELIETYGAIGNSEYKNASDNFRFAAGVVCFSQLLRQSKYNANASYDLAAELIKSSALNSESGHKTELLYLIQKSKELSVIP